MTQMTIEYLVFFFFMYSYIFNRKSVFLEREREKREIIFLKFFFFFFTIQLVRNYYEIVVISYAVFLPTTLHLRIDRYTLEN